MSDLGKIREGSPRVYRDRIFGQRGSVTHLNPEQSVDGRRRVVFHADDITEEQRAEYEAALIQREQAEETMTRILKHAWGDAENGDGR